MKKRKFKGTFLYGFLVSLLYVIVFPPGTGKEYVVTPVASYDLGSESDKGIMFDNSGITKSFRVGERFGFVDSKLNLLHNETIDYDIALSDTGYINYSSIQEGDQGFVLCNQRGEVRTSLQFPGYPALSEDGKRIFIVKTDGTGLCEVTQDGDELWNVSYSSIVTSLAIGKNYVLLGLLNGNVRLYDGNGKSVYAMALRDSKTETVYGCAISDDETDIAAVYGIKPQRVVVVKKRNADFSKPAGIELGTDFRKPVQMDFTEDGELLYIEGRDGLIACDVESLSMRTIRMKGSLAGIDLSGDSAYVVAITRFERDGKTNAGIFLAATPNVLFSREYFSGTSVSASLFGNRLLVGLDDNLAIFEIGEV